jgi:L-fucose isomerase-like protein
MDGPVAADARGRPRIGVVPLARPTFDVPFAEAAAAAAFAALDRLDAEIVGPRSLLFDAAAVEAALPQLTARPLDLLLGLQVTFTDATMTVRLAERVGAPLVLWAFPEARTGGRLRLNSLCGVNLAAHALGRAGHGYGWVHGAPDDAAALEEVRAWAEAGRLRSRLQGMRLGLAGQHPDGFDTCRYDAGELRRTFGVEVAPMRLADVFAAAEAVPEADADRLYAETQAQLGNLDALEQEPLRKSLKTYAALRSIADREGLAGMAVRCWPEFFTEYGCAACGAMAKLNEDGTPAGCEADVYGTLTTVMLRELSGQPCFMADLVDVDPASDTAVLWHCGLAPLSMADAEGPVRATIHSNRRKPLLNEFGLKPGRVTIARVSQAGNRTRLVLAGGEMLRAPLSFSGTSGVVRFDDPAAAVLDRLLEEGLEHHTSFAYGEHRPALRRFARMAGLPVLELTR